MDKKTKEDITVHMKDTWRDTGAGLDYIIEVTAQRGDKIKTRNFKYRDGLSSSGDNWNFYFKDFKINEVDNKGVEVELINGGFKYPTYFEIEKEEQENILSENDQERFEKQYQSTLEELKDRHHRKKGKMPAYHHPGFRGVGNHDVAYEKPSIEDQYMNKKAGKAVVILKSQIDSRAEAGRQFEWVAYMIEKDKGAVQIDRKCAYERNIDREDQLANATKLYEQNAQKD